MVVVVVPFKNFKEKIRVIKELQERKFMVEVFENYIYAEHLERRIKNG